MQLSLVELAVNAIQLRAVTSAFYELDLHNIAGSLANF